jgi:hypothetical protein
VETAAAAGEIDQGPFWGLIREGQRETRPCSIVMSFHFLFSYLCFICSHFPVANGTWQWHDMTFPLS